MNKKGIIFSLMAILLVSIFVFSLKPISHYTLVNRVPVIESRIQISNDYVADLEDSYLERVLFISSRGALKTYLDEKKDADKFDTEDTFKTTFDNLLKSGKYGAMNNNFNISNILNDIINLANETMYIETNFKFGESDIYQNISPWFITVVLEINYTVNASLSRWEISRNITSEVSIFDLYDPYIAINTNNPSPNVLRKIKRTTISNPDEPSSWGLNNFKNLINNQEYRYYNYSPSFYMRVLNQSGSSECCGIESVINKSNAFWKDDGVLGGNSSSAYRNISFFDFCYFGGGEAHPMCQDNTWLVDEISTDFSNGDLSYPFRIDQKHIGYYYLSDYDLVSD